MVYRPPRPSRSLGRPQAFTAMGAPPAPEPASGAASGAPSDDSHQASTDQHSPGRLYPPQGDVQTLWSLDLRRWDEPEYRTAVETFVLGRIPGANLRSATVLLDDGGQMLMGASTCLHADGSFRRHPDGTLARARVIVLLPRDVHLP